MSLIVTALVALCLPSALWAQATQPGPRGPAGDWRQILGRLGTAFGEVSGMGGMMGAEDPLSQLVANLGEASLDPAFTLTAEQKTKIQAVRDDFKKQIEKWRTDQADTMKKIREQIAGMFGGGGRGGFGGNPQAWQDVMKAGQDLMATIPSSDEAVKQIEAALTAEQLKVVQVKAAARQAEIQKRQQEMQEMFGGFGGGRFGGGRGGRPGGDGGGPDGGGKGPKPGDL
jgi:hypothetical protein